MLGILLYIAAGVWMGCASCFFGKRLYFPILALTVFPCVLASVVSLFDLTWKVGLAALAAGTVAALLSVVLYKLGVFMLGGVLGAGLGQLLASLLLVRAEWLHWGLTLLPALVLGLCALRWCGLFIMASTAYQGAVTAVFPLGFLALQFRDLSSFVYADGMFSTVLHLSSYLKGAFAQQYGVPLFVASIILAAAGFLIQYRTEQRR